ncbi:hypothetical protein RHSIM_Rhsim05G0217300 [Rhododendron simsii]|uniref:Uncharacterized protein n=1 Tax=Rhododendron simsii TaxID=118357 RepID=A0A834GZH3_RHOSS|nr:hypothetical protein RHSIM_Rhsim05G0217300 [Rhododendron simsii]
MATGGQNREEIDATPRQESSFVARENKRAVGAIERSRSSKRHLDRTEKSLTPGQGKEKLLSQAALVARALKLGSILLKGEAEEGKPGGTNWGQKGIRRWATVGERDQKRADWNRRVQGNGLKRRAQHNRQVRRRAGGRGRD